MAPEKQYCTLVSTPYSVPCRADFLPLCRKFRSVARNRHSGSDLRFHAYRSLPNYGNPEVKPTDWSRETLGPYRDCPERRSVGVRGRVVGAVSIGSFELSRWRLRRTRWAMGFQSVRAGCRASLKQATERKGEPALFLNIALES